MAEVYRSQHLIIVTGPRLPWCWKETPRPGEHEAAIQALPAGASSIRCVQILCRASEELRRERIERRAREALRHPGQLDASTPYSSAAATFLEIPSIRLEFGGSESSKATEQLIAALDVSMQQPP